MKQLPLGTQDFSVLINNDYLYVDKTPLALDVIQKGRHYFLSRPRRFGKSLFLSTLQHIFQADKELFKGLAIERSDYKWEKYPVLYFDFSGINLISPEEFKESIMIYLEEEAEKYNIPLKGGVSDYLRRLVKKLSEINPVVVLIDEYDKPLLDHIKDPELVEKYRMILRDFFSTLKSLDGYLRFTFTTGISRFSRASLFSGFNSLTDISFDEDYAAIAGYTEEEIDMNFKEHIAHCASLQQTDEKSIRELMKEWYNGYRFSESSLRVYNPYSTLHFLNKGKAQNYWYSSGTPTFLIHQLENFHKPVTTLQKITLDNDSLSEISDVRDINLPSLMFQSGYLSIKSYDAPSDTYDLEFPNEEVRISFFKSLHRYFSGGEGKAKGFKNVEALFKAFKDIDIPAFVNIINEHFINLAYDLFDSAKERSFQGLLVSVLEISGVRTQCESHTYLGRIDLLVEREKVIYVMEFKLDKSAKEAMGQIKEKRYLDAFFNRGKKVVAVGLNFSSKERQISDYLIEEYSEGGKLLKA